MVKRTSKTWEVVSTSDTCTRLLMSGREIVLIKTAHISRESVEEVKRALDEERPERVCVEIDRGRYENLMEEGTWESLDIQKILKEKKGFLLLGTLVLASFQKKLGDSVGVKPGEEMKQAILGAKERGIPYTFSDRPIQTTFLRAWRTSRVWSKVKLLVTLLFSSFLGTPLGKEEVEVLKKTSVLQAMMEKLGKILPSIKRVLIDERDRFLAASIFTTREKKVVAVVGAGHGPGIVRFLREMERGDLSPETEDLMRIPPKGWLTTLFVWSIPVVMIGIFLTGFLYSGPTAGLSMIKIWLLANGVPAAMGGIVACAHPITILVSFVAAPLTSMNPTVGVGLFSGLTEAILRKPRVVDLERLHEDASHFKKWYKNRALHILLVVIFTTLGSIVGTGYAFSYILTWQLTS